LLARIDPPPPQRPGEPEPLTHRQIHLPLASLFNLVEVDGEFFHVVREALLPDGAIDRCGRCRDRRRRCRGSGNGREDDEDERDDEDDDAEDGVPSAPPLASAAAASATLPVAPAAHPDGRDELYNARQARRVGGALDAGEARRHD
jgi:hypothetical protein